MQSRHFRIAFLPFPNFARRIPVMLTEALDEIRGTPEPHLISYFRNGVPTAPQQLHGASQPDVADELACRAVGVLLNPPEQVRPAHVHPICEFGNAELFIRHLSLHRGRSTGNEIIGYLVRSVGHGLAMCMPTNIAFARVSAS